MDYYFQALGYIGQRTERRARFDADTQARNVLPPSPEYAKEFKSYCGRERVLLRRRRAKLRVDQFHTIAQVGQGGYGEVYLARKYVCLSSFFLTFLYFFCFLYAVSWLTEMIVSVIWW